MTATRWGYDRAWPALRPFDDKAALAAMESATSSAPAEIRTYDSATRTTKVSTEVHHIPAPTWSALVVRPELGPDEAWFYYAVLWKPRNVSVAAAVTAARPTDLLARLRSDLAERAISDWFDARVYWCCVVGLLSREDLARFVGDARVFVHSYRDGGSSIITGHSARVAFIEGFYEMVAPYLTAAEWKLVANEVGAIDRTLLDAASTELAMQRLRMAAATGQSDREILAILDAAHAAKVEVLHVLHAMHDASHLATHAPRLECYLLDELSLEKWIERFGAERSAWIVASIMHAKSKKDAAPLVATLARILPDASIMEQLVDSKAGPDVRKWLARAQKASAKPARMRS